MDLAIAGDLRGHLVGTVSTDGGTLGVGGAEVEASGVTPLGAWRSTTLTRADGRFTVDLPPASRGTCSLAARKNGDEVRLEVDCADIIARLTPRPEGRARRCSLEGQWEFRPDPSPGPSADLPWASIQVPSHWEMEGFIAESGAALYRKRIRLPAGWAGKRLKLRSEGIYSRAEVSVNGARAGAHIGGATPFELDVTESARPGAENRIEILVADRSVASVLDAMSYYAHFNLGGIWRPLEIFCVEPAHVSRLALETRFDAGFRDAELRVDVDIENERASASGPLRLDLSVVDPAGRALDLGGWHVEATVGPWQRASMHTAVRVPSPLQWSAEAPRLYLLRARLSAPGQPVQTIEQPFGFRQVDITDGIFLVNGRPVKLWGACRHDAHPLRGRAITAEIARRDAELMKEANLNAFRTSHYLPHPAALDEADRLGLYVEDEVPLCFIGVPWGPIESRAAPEDLRLAPLCIALTAETIERDRNHACVSIWSQCNESRFGPILIMASEVARELDPSRPLSSGSSGDLAIKTFHNPTTADLVREHRDSPVPVLMDESLAIFQAMGPQAGTIESDPGLRDYWDTPHRETVEAIRQTPRNFGHMIWAWVDDAFMLPGRGVEYGRMNLPTAHFGDRAYRMRGRGILGDPMWGVIDGWRRPMPEHWLCRKLHSPIRVRQQCLQPQKTVAILVENRNTFVDLDRCTCHWRLGGAAGRVKATGRVRPAGPPGSTTELCIPLSRMPAADDALELEFRDESGRCIESCVLPFATRQPRELSWSGRPARFIEEPPNLNFASIFRAVGKRHELAWDRVSGRLVRGIAHGLQALSAGPALHLRRNPLPLEEFPVGWRISEVSSRVEGDRLVVRVDGSYGNVFAGGFVLELDDAGALQIHYRFRNNGADLLVNEIGLAFDLPPECDRLSWDRSAEWSGYPEDHIGRPRGTAVAHPKGGQEVPPGDRPYSQDDHPWGCNDFRGTKRGIWQASLTDARGTGIEIRSDASQHVRAAMGIHGARLHLLDFYGGVNTNTSEWDRSYGTGRAIKSGEELAGTARLLLLPGSP